MSNPQLPYPITGTVTNSSGIATSNVIITFTTSSGSVNVTTDSLGKYIIDLADAIYTSGETVSYSAIGPFNNETYSGTFTLSGSNKTLNITLSLRTSQIQGKGNRQISVVNIGGKPISQENPLPVISNSTEYIDLNNNPSTAWTITRADLQPDSETVTFGNGDSYKRTFTYNSNNVMITRSEWVKQ